MKGMAMAVSSQQSSKLVSDEMIRQFNERGYFILENVIPAEHMEILRVEWEYYLGLIHAEMDRQGKDVLGINHRNKRYFVGNRYRETGRILPVIFSDYMADICRATLGPDVFMFNEQYVVKAAEVGLKFAWHQDSGYIGHPHRPYLSCWCALDDMTVENGTIDVLPYDRAGTKQVVEHKLDPVLNDRIGYTGSDPGEPVIVPAGSIAVFSSVCLHRSGANVTSKPRRVWLAQYSAEPIMTKDGNKVWACADPFLKDGEVVADMKTKGEVKVRLVSGS
jgi:ectoine hydroxylase-related dioxygenase (phytanoyl-CoA dioxygenase family)